MVPRSDLDMEDNISMEISSNYTTRHENIIIKPSKPFTKMPQKDFSQLFQQKCDQCCRICDFSSDSIDSSAKESKGMLLKQLQQVFLNPAYARMVTAKDFSSLIRMVSANLFRYIPIFPTRVALIDLTWPHLSLIYELFSSSLSCQHGGSIDQQFLSHLASNGAYYADERERLAVRDLLHKIYTNFVPLRDTIRIIIGIKFSSGLCSPELLEFYTSIVTGFSVPLKLEHSLFFARNILPLHTLDQYSLFSNELTQCIIRYISKSNVLFIPAIDYIISHWSVANREKQILLLNEIEALIVNYHLLLSPESVRPIIKLIGDNAHNENSDVAMKALDIILNSELVPLYKLYSKFIYPELVANVYKAAKKHWDDSVSSNAQAALQTLSEIDPIEFSKVNQNMKIMKQKRQKAAEQFLQQWTLIMTAAVSSDKTVKPSKIEFLKRKAK